MHTFTTLQLAGTIIALVSSGILIGAVIGFNTPDKNGESHDE